MRNRHIFSFFVLALLVAACAEPTASPTTIGTDSPFIPAPITPVSTPYPAPAVEFPAQTPPSYPGPSTPPLGTLVIPPSGYEPQPGDASLQRGEAIVDLANSQVFVTTSDPAQAKANLIGNLPDQCHLLRVIVAPPDTSNTINLEVYSVVDANKTCSNEIEPFSVTIPLGNYNRGEFDVKVNGEQLGQLIISYAPQPGDEKLTRGEVNIDLNLSSLMTLTNPASEVAVVLQGNLPDPCHQLRIMLTPANSENKINLDVYSVFDPQSVCIMVIKPFEVTVPLGMDLSGHYSVYVNGQLLSEFTK